MVNGWDCGMNLPWEQVNEYRRGAGIAVPTRYGCWFK